MTSKAVRWEDMDKGNVPLEKQALQYEAFNRTEGKTEKTVSWYQQTLHLLNEYLIGEGHSTLLKDFSLEVIRTYILYLQTRPKYHGHPYTPDQGARLSPQSINSHIRAIRAFFNWLHLEGYTEKPILEHV